MRTPLSVVTWMLRDMDVTTLLAGAVLLALGALLGWLAARARATGAADETPAAVAALLGPASDALVRVENRLREVERDRVGAYAGLREQVAALHRSSADLGTQTRALVGALRAPTVRGRWGELQLQRIVELAGMVDHCDFDTQVHVAASSSASGADRGARPDLVVRLAGDRSVPVDAKVPFAAWLEALDTQDPDRRAWLMGQHARALRTHVDVLASKAYWQHFQPAPEFVVMFVPGEPLLDAAMTIDPSLTEHAFARNVLIATPTTLIALLRTIAFGWRQERLSRSAEEIHQLGRDLHARLATVTRHLDRVGAGLDRAVEAYNAASRSLDSRLLVTAQRFADLGVATDSIDPPRRIDARAHPPRVDGPTPTRFDDPEVSLAEIG